METTEAEESLSGGGGVEEMGSVKQLREQVESRIERRHKEQEELLLSLQTLVPQLFSSLNLSLQIISTFHRRHFTPLAASSPPPPSKKPHHHHLPLLDHITSLPLSSKKSADSSSLLDAVSLLRSMLAVCLLERIPFDPIDSSMLFRKLHNDPKATPADKAALRHAAPDVPSIESALRSMADDCGGLELAQDNLLSSNRANATLMVMSIDRTRLLRELPETHQDSPPSHSAPKPSHPNNNMSMSMGGWPPLEHPQHMYAHMPMRPLGTPPGSGRPFGMMPRQHHHHQHRPLPPPDIKTDEEMIKDVEEILNKKSFKETLKSEAGKEIFDLLHRSTAKQRAIAEKFKTKGGPQLQHYCLALTKEDCRQKSGSYIACEKIHFRRIIAPHTDINLGDCSFLDTCRHMKTCKYVHYELDPTPDVSAMMGSLAPPKPLKTQRAEYCSEVELGESQWISCDIRNFRMDILGQFGVIMADPPWDIHMELPYGTMADEEMRNLNIPALQTDGLIFLWVTGRAMELGRECLELWGYKRVEEIIWVKTNQLQRIIRTGRTGHWLNHSKEHCLVGIKGNPLVNRNIDTDVIVAEVRETSRKPDEMYSLLERISPRTRKLELFARMHNTQSGWLSLGNQLNGVRLVDEGLRARFKAAYPEVEVQPTSPPRTVAMEMEMEEHGGVTTLFSGVDTTTASLPAVTMASQEQPSSTQDVDMTMAQDAFSEHSLFGGAVSMTFPVRFQDLSNMRQVPDHQEAYADPNRDESIIVELLDLKNDVGDENSAVWFLQDLASEQDAEGGMVIEQSGVIEAPGLCYQNTPAVVTSAVGQMAISKGRQGREAQNIVRVYLANLRLKEVGTDVLITAYEPVVINALSESAGTVGAGVVRPAEQSGCTPMAQIFKLSVSSFKVNDWSLFQA